MGRSCADEPWRRNRIVWGRSRDRGNPRRGPDSSAPWCRKSARWIRPGRAASAAWPLAHSTRPSPAPMFRPNIKTTSLINSRSMTLHVPPRVLDSIFAPITPKPKEAISCNSPNFEMRAKRMTRSSRDVQFITLPNRGNIVQSSHQKAFKEISRIRFLIYSI